MSTDQWGTAITGVAGFAVLGIAFIAFVARKRRVAFYLIIAAYILLWPILLWFWQFTLTERSPIPHWYLWSAVQQIVLGGILPLIWFCFSRRFRPVATAFFLAYTLSLLLQLFSYMYWTYGTAKNFSIPLSHLDSFYFALGTLTTAGTGNISAISETVRGLQALQMALGLVLIGFVVALVLARYSNLFNNPQIESRRDNAMTATFRPIMGKPRQPRRMNASNDPRSDQPATIPHGDDEQASAAIRPVVELIEALFPAEPWEPASWPTCAALAAQVEAAVTTAEADPELAEQRGSLLRRLGIYLGATAQYAAARSALERALGITEVAHGPNHPDVARTLDELGVVQMELGEREAARASQERALGIFEAAYGPGHLDVARVLGNLGNVQAQMGELDAARTTYERALAIEEAAYGPDHPDIARTLVGLGAVLSRLGERTAARASEERALGIFEAAYGPDHPDVAKALGNLGLFQRQAGELDAARTTYERALAIEEAAYGPDHPDVAMTLNNLSIVQRRLGDRQAARASEERAVSIFETVYGPSPLFWRMTRRLLTPMNRFAGYFHRGPDNRAASRERVPKD